MSQLSQTPKLTPTKDAYLPPAMEVHGLGAVADNDPVIICVSGCGGTGSGGGGGTPTQSA